MQHTYGYNKVVDYDFFTAIEKAKEALKNEGFGILSEIDIKAKIKEKLDKDFENYIILGACNPPLAYQALQTEHEIGLLLPCNIIVYEKEGKVMVSAIRPLEAMRMINNPDLNEIALQVEEKLKRVIDSV